MLSLEAAMLSNVAVSGTYEFHVVSSGPNGNSNVSQGGAFAANANEKASLGKVMINGDAKYQIDFKVTANGAKLDCSQDVAALR